MSKSIEVKLDNKVVVVEKLAIMRYAEMLKAIKELPKHLGGLDLKNLDVKVLVEQLPFLVSVALPDIINILVIATNLKQEEVEKLGLDEIVDLFVAVYQINNYQKVFDQLKKVTAQPELVPISPKQLMN